MLEMILRNGQVALPEHLSDHELVLYVHPICRIQRAMVIFPARSSLERMPYAAGTDHQPATTETCDRLKRLPDLPTLGLE
jgi:hypothetical protein